ncbi:MAG: enoyl-CoA hydratase/isomerase family protein [Rhizobiaceae bacterium]|nr:enoyl-CoA hydratase/isomerase family protein [Rhizobiaceae bacterium]
MPVNRGTIEAGGGPAALLELARPDVGNALGPAMVDGLSAALADAQAGEARLIALLGAGKHLCTGFDLSDLEAQSDGDLLLRFVRIEMLLQEVHDSPVPTLAVAKGRTFGAGADLFVACDRRYCLAETRFSFPGPGFGLVLGSRRLAGRIGRDPARDILQSGRVVGAAEAVSIGLATAIIREDEIEARIAEDAAAASRHAADTVRALRAATAGASNGAADLAALVASASRPGLKSRIMAYAGQRKAAPAS